MVSKTLTVTNAQGFHMRPAMNFTTEMNKYPCTVTLRVNQTEVDGKSLMKIIAAGIKCGAELEIICDGEQENEALAAAVSMIESGFGE